VAVEDAGQGLGDFYYVSGWRSGVSGWWVLTYGQQDLAEVDDAWTVQT
jgi:hypothetical protein